MFTGIYSASNDHPGLFRGCCLLFIIAVMLVIGYSHPARVCQAQTYDDDLIGGFEDMDTDPRPTKPDDPIDGFEDLEDADKNREQRKEDGSERQATLSAPKKNAHFGGYAKATAAYNFARKPPGRGLHHLKTELFVEGDFKSEESWRLYAGLKGSYDVVYQLNGREKYTRQIIDEYESELELKEVYLQGSVTPNLDFKLGRQIVIWGRSDNIRVVDMINPMDLREPGVTDIEDLRLPVTMTKLDYYSGLFNLSGMLIHEVRFTKIAPYGSEFYPLSFPPPKEEIPADNWTNTQYAVALNGTFSGWDLSFYWADLYSAAPHMAVTDSEPFIVQRHARYNLTGSAANVIIGNWLLKGEVAWLSGLKFTNSPDKSYDEFDLLVGLEYSGIANMQVGLEIANQHLLDYEEILSNEPDKRDMDQLQWAARLTKNFMNEALAVTLLISVYGEMWQDGAFQRFSMEYDLTDTLKINGGIVLYQSGDLTLFKNVEHNDRFLLEMRYSF